MQIVIHENKEDYTASEVVLLKQAFQNLEVKAKEGTLSIEETRIRVAYIRYQREDNFKIVLEKKPTKSSTGEKRTSTRKNTPKSPSKDDSIMRAQQLWVAKNLGKQLTPEELDFVEKMLPPPPDL